MLPTSVLYKLLTAPLVELCVGNLFSKRVYTSAGWIAVPPRTANKIKAAIFFGLYEYPEKVMIRKWLPAKRDVIEVGGSLGVITNFIRSRLDKDALMVTVEANRALIPFLKQNVANGVCSTSKTIVMHGAASAAPIQFVQGSTNLSGQLIESRLNEGIYVPNYSISQIAFMHKLTSYSIVMDIEGSEYDLLENDLEGILKAKCIICELHGLMEQKIAFIQKLLELGYRYVDSKHTVHVFLKNSYDSIQNIS
jgi:FkbM family methyltransferase